MKPSNRTKSPGRCRSRYDRSMSLPENPVTRRIERTPMRTSCLITALLLTGAVSFRASPAQISKIQSGAKFWPRHIWREYRRRRHSLFVSQQWRCGEGAHRRARPRLRGSRGVERHVDVAGRSRRWESNGGGEGGADDKPLARIQFAHATTAAFAAALVPKAAVDSAAAIVAADQQPDGSWRLDSSDSLGSPATYGTASRPRSRAGRSPLPDCRRSTNVSRARAVARARRGQQRTRRGGHPHGIYRPSVTRAWTTGARRWTC